MRIFSHRAAVSKAQLIVEVLVGTLVVVLLVGILVPIFAGNGRRPPHAACMSNTKQIITSLHIYASDADNTFPQYFTFDSGQNGAKFKSVVQPYLKNERLWVCPTDANADKGKGYSEGAEGNPEVMSYVHCLSLRTIIPDFAKGARILDLDEVAEPAKTLYMRDPIRGYPDAYKSTDVSFLSPHGTRFNVSFLDGHVKGIVKIDEFKEL